MLALKTGLKYILDIEVIEFADGLDGAGQRERKELEIIPRFPTSISRWILISFSET